LTSQRTIYTTYFDSGYLSRGLTLINSIRTHDDFSDIWVLCLDEDCFKFLSELKLGGVFPVSIENFETSSPELQNIKLSRSRIEYIFSIGPSFIWSVMKKSSIHNDLVIYLDADLYFFANPQLVSSDMKEASVGIIEHKYPKGLESRLSKYGKFNVGWVGFRNDQQGSKVLSWWAEECIKWCFDFPENGNYADQGYLNAFPSFEGVKVLESPGFNLAPWNTGKKTTNLTNHGADIFINDEYQLVFFHFHGVKETRNWYITSQLVYKHFAGKKLIQKVYVPYLKELQQTEKLVTESHNFSSKQTQSRGKGLRGFAFTIQRRILNIVSILTGNAVRKN
jgi:hypothetical protein